MLNEEHLYLISLLWLLFMLCLKVASKNCWVSKKTRKTTFPGRRYLRLTTDCSKNTGDTTAKFNNLGVSGKHKIKRWYYIVLWNKILCWEHLFDIKHQNKNVNKTKKSVRGKHSNICLKHQKLEFPDKANATKKSIVLFSYQLGKIILSTPIVKNLHYMVVVYHWCSVSLVLDSDPHWYKHIKLSSVFLIYVLFYSLLLSLSPDPNCSPNTCLHYIIYLSYYLYLVYFLSPNLNVYLFPFPFIPNSLTLLKILINCPVQKSFPALIWRN